MKFWAGYICLCHFSRGLQSLKQCFFLHFSRNHVLFDARSSDPAIVIILRQKGMATILESPLYLQENLIQRFLRPVHQHRNWRITRVVSFQISIVWFCHLKTEKFVSFIFIAKDAKLYMLVKRARYILKMVKVFGLPDLKEDRKVKM